MKHTSALCGAACLILASCAGTSNPQDRFAQADANNDGKLTRKEISDAAVTTIFRQFDANRDGKLTFEEWQRSDKSADRRLFAERDANGDGYLTLEEAKASADRQKFLQEFFNKVDLNRDGFISREEAAAYAEKHGHSAL